MRLQAEWGVPLLLALAVSIDGFSAGFSCGLRKLTIPFTSLLVIASLSAGAIALSMLAGSGFAYIVPHRCISALGGAVLIIFGLVVMRQHSPGSKEEAGLSHSPEQGEEESPAHPRNFSTLLRRPEAADLDRSGTLSAAEALLLGSALAADAFAAGFGAALIGSPLLPTVLAVGSTKMLLLPLGVIVGRAAGSKIAPGYIPLLGGAILIFLGIMNLF